MDGAETQLSASIEVIILNIFQTIAGIFSAILVDKIGRRPLLINTTFLAGCSLLISGIFFYLYDVRRIIFHRY